MPEIELRPARPAEFDAIVGLLSATDLPVDDLNVTMLDAFVVATEGEDCVGVVGLEIHESNALLRSLAVAPRHRSRGLGSRLVDAIETDAPARGVTAVYLLTTTATTFFERAGYTAHDRAAVPPSIAATTEFSSLCPDTADCLWRDLTARLDVGRPRGGLRPVEILKGADLAGARPLVPPLRAQIASR